MTDNNDDRRGDRTRARPERPAFARGPQGDRPLHRKKPPRSEARPEERAKPPEAPVTVLEPAEERIAKVIARAGIASRRDAEAMIAEGRVTLNGEVLQSPAINVTPKDRITVDGEPLPLRERTRLWIFNKPPGIVTTARDPEGRTTVFDVLPEELPRVVSIGRLDINTEGLLLLTNDGGLARVIAHPDTGWLRRYKVRAFGDVSQADLDALRGGVTVDEMDYGPVEAVIDRVQGDNVWITLGLREGKNREVKRILEHLGLRVNRLIRLSFGPFQLGELEQGLVEEVRTKVLRDQLGDALSQEAGVDFESPVREPIAPFGSPKRLPEARDHRGERPRRPDDGERSGSSARARPEHGDRPPRGDRPQRAERFAARDGAGPRKGPGDAARSGERPERPRPGERRPAIWRAEDGDAPRRSKAPRRGEDPRAARESAGERPRQRAAAIENPAGRKVMVERLVSAPPREEARPRDGRPPRRFGSGGPPRNRGGPPQRDERGRGGGAFDGRQERAPRQHGPGERGPRQQGPGERGPRDRAGEAGPGKGRPFKAGPRGAPFKGGAGPGRDRPGGPGKGLGKGPGGFRSGPPRGGPRPPRP